jgi:hypothetical protein
MWLPILVFPPHDIQQVPGGYHGKRILINKTEQVFNWNWVCGAEPCLGWALAPALIQAKLRGFSIHSICQLRASPPVHCMWLQTVKFIGRKSKCAGFPQEIAPTLLHLAVAGKGCNTVVHLQKRVINWTWWRLRLSISFWLVQVVCYY